MEEDAMAKRIWDYKAKRRKPPEWTHKYECYSLASCLQQGKEDFFRKIKMIFAELPVSTSCSCETLPYCLTTGLTSENVCITNIYVLRQR